MEELSLDLNEGRVVGDGVAYTFEEYVDICGFSLEEQLCVAALSRWRTNSAEQPVDTIGANPESLAEQHGDINSAAQPVHLTASSLSSVVDGSLSYGHRFWTELNRQRGSSSRSNSSSSSTLKATATLQRLIMMSLRPSLGPHHLKLSDIPDESL